MKIFDNGAVQMPVGETRLERENTVSPLLDQAATARLLGVAARTLESWRLRGGGQKFVRISARMVRYRPEDLAEFIFERVRRNTSEQPGQGEAR